MKKRLIVLSCIVFLTACSLKDNEVSTISEEIEVHSSSIEAAISSSEEVITSQTESSSLQPQSSASSVQDDVRSYDYVMLQPASKNIPPFEARVGDVIEGLTVESLRYEEREIDGEWRWTAVEVRFSGEYTLSGTYYYQGGMNYFVPDDNCDLPAFVEYPKALLIVSTWEKEYEKMIEEKGASYQEGGEAVAIPISKLVITDYVIQYYYESGASPIASIVSMAFAE